MYHTKSKVILFSIFEMSLDVWYLIYAVYINKTSLTVQKKKHAHSSIFDSTVYLFWDISHLNRKHFRNQLHVNLYKWVVLVVKQLQRNFNSSIVRMLTMLSLYSSVWNCFTITEQNSNSNFSVSWTKTCCHRCPFNVKILSHSMSIFSRGYYMSGLCQSSIPF